MTPPAPDVMHTPGAEAKSEARESLSTNRGPSYSPALPMSDAHSKERIPTIVVDEHEDIARVVAERIATLIRERAAAGRPCVLGLATGSTDFTYTAPSFGNFTHTITAASSGYTSATATVTR